MSVDDSCWPPRGSFITRRMVKLANALGEQGPVFAAIIRRSMAKGYYHFDGGSLYMCVALRRMRSAGELDQDTFMQVREFVNRLVHQRTLWSYLTEHVELAYYPTIDDNYERWNYHCKFWWQLIRVLEQV